jgi:hypothetical protein
LLLISDELEKDERLLSPRQLKPDKEHDDRADNGHDETGRMKRRTRLRFGEQPADQSSGDRTSDPKQRGHYEAEMLCTRHDGARNQTDDETDDDVPDDV